MQLKSLLANPLTAFVVISFAVSAPMSAHADTIGWANWSGATAGTPGTATGTIGSITVTYSGENNGLLMNYPSWTPTATFTGGVVGNAPPAANNSVKLTGGSPITETITFSTPVADPMFAVWSLGAPGAFAEFNFDASEPFTVQGVVAQRSTAAQHSRSSVRAYKVAKAMASSSSTAPSVPSPSPRPTSRTTTPSLLVKTPRSPASCLVARPLFPNQVVSRSSASVWRPCLSLEVPSRGCARPLSNPEEN
jgi:hypothetical protein